MKTKYNSSSQASLLVRGRFGRLTLLSSALVLAGCAVTPSSMDVPEALKSGEADQKILAEATPLPKQKITLEEAMARALLHNRERRVQMMESAMAAHQLSVSRFDMLPQLAANAGYTQRDKLAASSSGVLENGEIKRSNPPTYSVSADRQSATSNLALSWNVLDFGLSYLRANQSADRLLIAKERERKALHNLIQDVRSAYWRAASAQKLIVQTASLRERVLQALADARRVETMRLRNPMEALAYQRDLLDVKRSLEALHRDLLDSRTNLATLMGLPPSTQFELMPPQQDEYKVPALKADTATLERTALALRPELMELRYQKRITESEGRAALLSLLPGLNLNAGTYKDSNDYLLYNNWTSHGLTLGMNLFNVFKAPSVNQLADAQKNLAQERRLALTAAVLGQVHLSRQAFDNASQQFETSSDYLEVVRKIRAQARQMRSAERNSEMDLIREEMAELLADLRRDVAFAELQNSYGRVFATAGLDPIPMDARTPADIPALAHVMRQQLEAWNRGEVGVVLNPLDKQVKPWRGPGQHSLRIAPDSFSLSGQLQASAVQSNGQPLPAWLKFDPKTQTFSGNPPAGQDRYSILYTVTDAAGARVTEKFTLQLDKVNDAPAERSEQILSFTEGGKPVQGRMEAVDADGDPLIFTLVGRQSLPPGFAFKADGQWQFDPSHPHWLALKAGELHETTLEIKATDPSGASGMLYLKLRVTGLNTNPEIKMPTAVRVDSNARPLEGRVEATDPDKDSKLSFSLVSEPPPEGFKLESDGRWRFDPAQPAYQALRKGESRNLFLPIKVSDEAGGFSITRLQLTVSGIQP